MGPRAGRWLGGARGPPLVYTYTCTCTYTYTWGHELGVGSVALEALLWSVACTHAHMHTCTHARMHTCAHAHMRTQCAQHVRTCTCVHAHARTCAHAPKHLARLALHTGSTEDHAHMCMHAPGQVGTAHRLYGGRHIGCLRHQRG